MCKNIGTNEKTLVLLRKTFAQTKKHWSDYAENMNNRKKVSIIKNIGTNEKAWFDLAKHMNQQKSIGFNVKYIGTSEKHLFYYEQIRTSEKALV